MEFNELEARIASAGCACLRREGDAFILYTSATKGITGKPGMPLPDLVHAEKMTIGFFSYELRHQFEQLKASPADPAAFPVYHYFHPEHVERISTLPREAPDPVPVTVTQRVKKNDYLTNAGNLLNHIHAGNIYEVNYCTDFYSQYEHSALALFLALYRKSPAPFAGLYKGPGFTIISMSPERFLKKTENRLISQPMKGTISAMEAGAADRLRNDPKERAENIMITDLVRNDLSRIAARGSVYVDELCGVYPFPGLYQMISTVSCEVDDTVTFHKIMEATFPMGSMTGAPKISAMNLISSSEQVARGPYSGSLGYFDGMGNFDMHVLIRSVFINTDTGYLTFSVGSALTAMCDPEQEYHECLLKASSILQVLSPATTVNTIA